MMKKYIFILIVLSSQLFFSCKDTLNVPPFNIITDDQVFTSSNGVDAYLVQLYRDMDYSEAWNTGIGNLESYGANISGESLVCGSCGPGDAILGDGTDQAWWNYAAVRRVNYFLEKFPSYKDKYLPDVYDQYVGEVKTIRAYYYFSMVKRYGGIPLVSVVLDYTLGADIETFKLPRSKEKDIYDFIAQDLDEAIPLLKVDAGRGRINKYTAYALKSRAMLYAASIAQFGTVQLDGIVGIPQANAASYWQAAYDAADAVILSGIYSLYKKYPTDLSKNYQYLFLDQSNPELIFAEYYSYPDKGHSWDQRVIPYQWQGPQGYASRVSPTFELVEQYEYIDGSNGALKLNDPITGNPIEYANPLDLYKDKDPRLQGTILVPGALWWSDKEPLSIQKGVIDGTVIHTSGNTNVFYDYINKVETTDGTGTGKVRIMGRSGPAVSGEYLRTGFGIRKYLDPTLVQTNLIGSKSTTPWIVFRLGEMYLNAAEAAFELGGSSNLTKAKEYVNKIRERAGIVLLSDGEVTRDRIRNERNVELAFEWHKWWDIIRWRTAASYLINKQWTGIDPYYVVQSNSYIFKRSATLNSQVTFLDKFYYRRITDAVISNDPNIIQNPGY